MLKNVCNYASVNVCLFGQNDFMEMELISLGSKSRLQRCWLEWRSVWVSRDGPWYTGRKNPAIVAIAYDVKWSSATMVAVMIFQLTGICLVKFCDIASNCTQQSDWHSFSRFILLSLAELSETSESVYTHVSERSCSIVCVRCVWE